MKGELIFDQLNDIVYISTDEPLRNHLIHLCEREGFVETQDDDGGSVQESTLDTNALVQLFSPLVTSQRIMLSQFNNPYQAVHAQDGTILVFAESLGFLFLAVGSEGEESLATIQQRLHIFLHLAKLLCGPVYNILRLSRSGGETRQKLLRDLISTWEDFRKTDLSFLIEAVERLLINQYLSSTCVRLLEVVLEKMRNAGLEASASHAFLLVNTKLLALFSSRNASELTASDILVLTLLAHTQHPHCRVELPRSPQPSPSPSPLGKSSFPIPPPQGNHRLQVPQPAEGEESSDAEGFYSPCGTPPKNVQVAKSAETSEEPVTTSEVLDNESAVNSDFNLKLSISSVDDLDQDLLFPMDYAGASDYSQEMVFLQAGTHPLIPHLVHSIRVMEGVLLIVVSDIGRSMIAGGLVQAIQILHACQVYKQPDQARQTLDAFESAMGRAIDSTKKFKITDPDADRILKHLNSRWSGVKKSGMADYMKSSTTRFMPSKLDSAVGALTEALREAFQVMCFSNIGVPSSLGSRTMTVLVDVQAHIRFNLADYADYLRVKSVRNIAITSYLNDFPGLVYFIYVNRINNQATLPTLEVSAFADANKPKGGIEAIKQKVLKMIEFTRTQLQLGHFAVNWRDSIFYYSYCLWFEDTKGDPLKPQALPHGLRNISPPGILCGDFYRQLTKECFPAQPVDSIQCYELLTMHHATSSPSMVAEHVQRLAASVWDLTRAGHSTNDWLDM